MFRTASVAIGVVLWAACSSSGDARPSGGGDTVPAQQPAPLPVAGLPAAPEGPIDTALARRGEALFTQRACAGCHKIGEGRFTGPDLLGVTERRTYPWILSMIMKPDSMIRADSIARRLFQEYMTPMANLAVQPDDARALYEYLRSRDAAQ